MQKLRGIKTLELSVVLSVFPIEAQALSICSSILQQFKKQKQALMAKLNPYDKNWQLNKTEEANWGKYKK